MPASNGSAPRGSALALAFPPELIDAIADAVAAKLGNCTSAETSSPYVDVDGAAAHLVATRQRIYDLVSAGQLTPRRDGRRLLFHVRDDLDAYLEGRA